MTIYPDWWQPGEKVVNAEGREGELFLGGGNGWVISLGVAGGIASYVNNPDPKQWSRVTAKVETRLTRAQLARVTYDAEVALCRAFGIHYAPYWEALPESTRTSSPLPPPNVVGRPDLDGIRAVVRGLVRQGLAPYVVE